MKIVSDETREQFRKGLSFVAPNRSATSGMTQAESRAFREELVKTLYSLKSTQDIVRANSQLLSVELKDNKALQDAVKNLGETSLSKTVESVLAKKDISNKEAKALVQYMEKFTLSMEQIDASLTVSMPMILDNLSQVLNDDTLSVAYRKEYLESIQKMLASSEVTKTLSKETVKEIEKLTKIQTSALNFTEKDKTMLNWTMTALKTDAKDVKLYKTLKNLDKSMNASVLTDKELKKTLKMQNSTNNTLKDMFEKQGGALSQGVASASGGMLQGALAMVSPELAQIVGPTLDNALGNFLGFLMEGLVSGYVHGEMTDKIPLKDKLLKLFKRRVAVMQGGGIGGSATASSMPGRAPAGGSINPNSPTFIGPPRPVAAGPTFIGPPRPVAAGFVGPPRPLGGLPTPAPVGAARGIFNKMGGIKGVLGTAGAVLSAGFAINDIIGASQEYDEKKITDTEKNRKQGKAVGGVAGMIGGAAIGSLVPIVGTTIGAIIGGIVGSIAGGAAGDQLGGKTGEGKYKTDKNSEIFKKAKAGASGMFGFISDSAKSVDKIVSEITGTNFTFTETIGDFITGRVQQLFDFVTKIGEMASKFMPEGVSTTVGGMYDKLKQAVGAEKTVATGEGMKGNAKTDQAMAFFQSQGWTKEQAAGIVGNLQVESGNMRPDVIAGTNANKDHGSMGVAQWRGDRVASFKKVMGKDLQGSSYEDQLAFVQWELTHSKKAAGDVLRGTKTSGEAAVAVNKYYEISAENPAGEQKRINAAAARAGEGYVAQATPAVSSTAKAAAATGKPALSNTAVTQSGQMVMIPSTPEGVTSEAPAGGANYFGVQNNDSAEITRLASKRGGQANTGGIPTEYAGGSALPSNTSMPSADPVGGGVNGRRLSIDDYGLAITNSIMFG